MAASKKIEEAVAEKRGMRMQDDEGPKPAGMPDILPKATGTRGDTNMTIVKKNFVVKSHEGNRISSMKGTHYEVEDGVLYLYDEDEPLAVFGVHNFCLEIRKASPDME